MKKKFLLMLLALVSALCLAFGLTACGKTKDNDGPDTPEHTHTWAAEWSSNSEGHFHYATCEGHETVKDKVIPHTFKNGECTICHYKHEAHSFGAYTQGEDGHSRTCIVCNKLESGTHNYVNGKCVTCDYEHQNHTYENGICTTCQYEHEAHSFGAYTQSEDGHSHICSVCHKSENGSHTYENGICTTCQYEHEAHSFGAYTQGEDGHSRTCIVCNKLEGGTHNYVNGKCVTCNYEHQNHTYENGTCTTCQFEHEDHAFVYSERTDVGHAGTCSVCGKATNGEHTYENGICTTCQYEHENHSYGADNACMICGAQKPHYSKGEDGTKIYFGEYPQTEVTDENDVDRSLRNSLNMATGSRPTSSNAGKWTDYNYYLDKKVESFMWYIDVDYQENRYRGVYFTNYRSYYTYSKSYNGSRDYSYQDENEYYTYIVYWFKYEPIEWRILEEKEGTALLMANIILDSQHYYYKDSGTRTVDGKTIYTNNYKESDIRKWLTETFYEAAFDEYAKQIIKTTEVDNSASSTAQSDNEYICENTQDKVFLLSWKEVHNTTYGFSSDSGMDSARQLKATDYAKSQGTYATDSSYRGNGSWWLRSPSTSTFGGGTYVSIDGYTYNGRIIYGTDTGVVPAICIQL